MRFMKRILWLTLTVLSFLFITAFASSGQIEITTAMQTGDTLIINGNITDSLKGVQLGLVILDEDAVPVYLSQTETNELLPRGGTAFSFPVITTAEDMSGKTVKISAQGYTPCTAVIQKHSAKEFFVSADASDVGADGSFASPFKTIQQARDAVRQSKASLNGEMTDDITVYIREGTYVLTESLLFDERDSGTNGKTITYCAYPGETPKIVAAKHVFTDWTLGENGVWMSLGGPDYPMSRLILQSGDTVIPARIPNMTGGKNTYFEAVRVGTNGSTESKTSFSVKASDGIPEISDMSSLNAVIWPNGDGWYNWTLQSRKVTNIEQGTDERIFKLSQATSYVINNGSRYYLEGAKEFLDCEGEFYYNRESGTLEFIPPSGVEMAEDFVVYASSDFAAIKVGVVGSKNIVKNIRFEGLEITGVGKGASGFGMYGVENIDIYGCRIHDLAGTGIRCDDIASDITVEGNEIYNVNTGVLMVSNLYSDKVSRVSHNTITNNHIYNMNGSGAGISVAESAYNVISHNRVHGSGRIGIWVYGAYLKSNYIDSETFEGYFGEITEDNVLEFMRSHDNVIEYNDVFDCMNDSQDGGPIYTSRSHHNIIRYNNIHDSYIPDIGPQPGMNGLYLDDDSDCNEVYGNSVYNISGINGGNLAVALAVTGNENVLTNNIVANNGIGASKKPTGVRFYGPNSHDNTATGNIYYNSGTNVLTSTYSFGVSQSDNNIIYNPTLDDPDDVSSYTFTINYESIGSQQFGAVSTDVWRQQRGYDTNTIAQDPLFMDAANDDFRFGIGSPAIEKGFYEIYRQAIGLKADYPYAQSGDYDKLFISIADRETNPGVIKLTKGAGASLNTLVRNDKGFVEGDAYVTFSSDTPSVVSVDAATGVVKALSPGTAKITACAGDVTSDVYIIVSEDAVWFEDDEGSVITGDILNYNKFNVKIDTQSVYSDDISALMPVVAVYSADGMVIAQKEAEEADGIFTVKMSFENIAKTPTKLKVFLWEKDTLTPKMSGFEYLKK